ncbi:MAG: glycosyltransferase, partial [Brasilonema sp.]
MSKYYLVYSSKLSLKPNTAHEIHDVMCANAAANLGYPTVLVYPNDKQISWNPLAWVNPFQPRQPEDEFVDFYNVQERLKVVPLPIPGLLERIQLKEMNVSTLVCKYYFPVYLRSVTKIVHTRDWNFVKVAVKNGIPTIYERHYYQETPFESDVVRNPFFKIAITQSEIIRQSLIKGGMPPEKVIWMHNGFEQSFLDRQPEEAEVWRKELLQDGRKHLVVYSGALYRFKGIDLLVDAARELPQIQFILTGGTGEQVQAYQQLAREKHVKNMTFLGWIIPRNRLVSLFQAADVLAHPHLSGDAANFTNPVKFFQYLASGTPIAVTEIPPLMEFKSSPM